MIDINVKYQVALFGSFQDITPTPDILKYLIDSFAEKQLIPTTFQEIGNTGVLNRLILKSSDDIWNIEIGSNKLDIFKNNRNIGVSDMNSLSIFIADAKHIAKIFDDKFHKKYNRLALVTRHLLKEMSPEEILESFKKNFNTIPLYKNNIPVDWKNRIVTRLPLKLKNKEISNVISEISRIRGTLLINSKIQTIDRIELKFDINTFQGNGDYRFENDDVCLFLDEALKLESTLESEYVKLIS